MFIQVCARKPNSCSQGISFLSLQTSGSEGSFSMDLNGRPGTTTAVATMNEQTGRPGPYVCVLFVLVFLRSLTTQFDYCCKRLDPKAKLKSHAYTISSVSRPSLSGLYQPSVLP